MNKTILSRASDTPWAQLKWNVPTKDIYKEFLALSADDFVLHRPEDKHVDWYATTLYGYSSKYTKSHWEYEGDKKTKSVTSVGEKCPHTMKWVETLPFARFDDVRFMVLKPGGVIKPHIDVADRNWLDPVCVAIHWPDHCYFRFSNHGEIPFKSGFCSLINIHHEHTVVNDSDETRVCLFIHGKKKKELWEHDIC